MDEPVVRGSGYVMDITEVRMANGRGVSDKDIDVLLKSKKRGVKKLKGDGDFRSEECIEYLKQADIVVTNPPFSLFREYVAQLMEYDKEFLIIGNVNAITYKEIFPLIKDNKLWLGASIHSGDRKFYVPDDYPLCAAGCGVDKDGRKYIRVIIGRNTPSIGDGAAMHRSIEGAIKIKCVCKDWAAKHWDFRVFKIL